MNYSKKLKDGKFQNVLPVRFKTMRAIKAKENKTTEVKFRLILVRNGIKGWKLHPQGVIGNPDFFFPKQKLAVFIDGCFWHGCAKCGHIPKANSDYWQTKISLNKKRDLKNKLKLKLLGFKVVRFWEHELKDTPNICLSKINKKIHQN